MANIFFATKNKNTFWKNSLKEMKQMVWLSHVQRYKFLLISQTKWVVKNLKPIGYQEEEYYYAVLWLTCNTIIFYGLIW